MRLDEAQIAEYDRRGLLFFPALLQEAETAELQTGLTDILNRAGPEIIREKEDPAAVRLAFGAHVYSEPFGRLIRHPDILRPVRQLLQDEVYLHQSRVNPKQGFAGGAAWDWHQDFPGWHYADGMPEPRCVMVAVFIDDCTAATSPLLVVPESQRHGLLDAQLHRDAEGYALYGPRYACIVGRRQGDRAVDRAGGLGLLLPQQSGARFGQQCLALAAGDPLLDLQCRG